MKIIAFSEYLSTQLMIGIKKSSEATQLPDMFGAQIDIKMAKR